MSTTATVKTVHHLGRRFLVLLVAAVLSVTGGVVLAQSGSAAPRPATFGRMPSDLVTDNQIDVSRVPDFVSTVDSEGRIVGYVRRDELMPVAPNGDLLAPPASQTVYARDGKTVVGRMDAGVGFTPVGVPAQTANTSSPTTTVQE